MGYLNNVTGYRDDLLANRAIVKHGNFALLTPDGLVKNIIPGFENCDATILSTPKLGASFVDYLVTLWICPYISRHLLSLNPLLACCRRYSRGER